MAPEQARGEQLDARADVFALGATLAAVLTGKPAFVGTAAADTIRKAANADLAEVFARLDACGADSELVALAKRCLSADRNARPADGRVVASEVAAYRAGVDARLKRAETDRAKAETQAAEQRKRRWVSRAAIAFLALGVVGTAAGMAEAWRQTDFARGETADKEKALGEKTDALAGEREASADLWDGLDAMTAEIVGLSLGTQTAVSEEQKKFLAGVLPQYRKLAAKAGNDEATRVRVARAARRVGLIEYRLGRRAESAAYFRQARDAFDGLAADFPAVPPHREELALAHGNLGVSLAELGRADEAEAEYLKGLALTRQLATDFPARPGGRRLAAAAHGNLGNLLVERGNAAAAQKHFETGIGLLENLVTDLPTRPDDRLDLASLHTSLGILQDGLGEVERSEGEHRKALAHLEGLAADPPAPPNRRFALASCRMNLGSVLGKQNKGKEAEAEYRKAVALLEKLAADFPAAPDYRDALAGGQYNLGRLTGPGRVKEREEQYRKAAAHQERLVADFPAVPSYRAQLAATHNGLGVLLAGAGRLAEAEAEFRKGLARLEGLNAAAPAVPEYRKELAVSHSQLGRLLSQLGRAKEAEAECRKALPLLEKLTADFPDDRRYQTDLATVYFYLGHVAYSGGTRPGSLAWFDKAVATLTPVHRAHPQDETTRRQLSNSLETRALLLDELGRYEEAVAGWDRAIDLGPKEDRPLYRSHRANSLLHAGRVAEAVAEVDDLQTVAGWPPHFLYDFACVYSVASVKVAEGKPAYADRAMELLGKAVKGGFKDAARLKADKQLDPLRDRDDFKKLLAGLGKK
jgi:tetratricopeptide (TPR) repeat protein